MRTYEFPMHAPHLHTKKRPRLLAEEGCMGYRLFFKVDMRVVLGKYIFWLIGHFRILKWMPDVLLNSALQRVRSN